MNNEFTSAVVSVKTVTSRDTVEVRLSGGAVFEILAGDYSDLPFACREGCSLPEDGHEFLSAADLKRRLYNAALSRLAYSDTTAYMLKQKLMDSCRRQGIKRLVYEPVCEQVCGIFTDKGYINDYEYGFRGALSLKSRHFGKKRIAEYLRQKGIGRDIVSEILDKEEFASSEEDITALLLKKYGTLSFKNRAEYKKAVAFLIRNGYNYDEAICYIEFDDEV